MMIKLVTVRIVLIAVTSSLLLYSSAIGAVQNIASTIPAKPLPVINEDPVKWRRDPFIENMKAGSSPQATTSTRKAAVTALQKQEYEFELQGIMQVDGTFHAMINGTAVKVGDKIGGITIKEISRFKVVGISESKEKIICDIYQGRINRGKK